MRQRHRLERPEAVAEALALRQRDIDRLVGEDVAVVPVDAGHCAAMSVGAVAMSKAAAISALV